MRIAGIEFPKELRDALSGGRLVVFAGAGVSMGEPAELPSFRELAEAIALGTGEVLQGTEPEARFLDRLAAKGVQVHSRAAQMLSRDDLEPTDLHRSLLHLYEESQSARIVTTNFDLLFEQAAESVFGSQPEAFTAPVLPSGGQFSGIVHVHGSIDRHEEMVLTEADFGKAYLTEGSARRFLVDLFNSFSVLFVGYSHEDVVMRYLGGALRESRQGSRFVLTHETDDSKWQVLGIKPILYQMLPDGSHAALREGVDGLANHARRSVLDWQRDITEIASRPPSLDEEAMDLVDAALSDPTRTRFFTEAASDPRWVGWLELHGHLDTLFVPADQQLMEQHARLAWWLAKTFLRDQPGVLFLLIQRKGMRLHWRFWWELARAAGRDQQPRLARDVLAQWVSLLLATMPPFPDEHVLSWLGERCADAELTDSLLDVFDAVIVNRLTLKPGYATPGAGGPPPIAAEFEPRSDEFTVRQLWDRQIRPRLGEIAEPLLMRAAQKFVEQHRLLRVWDAADDNWDATSRVLKKAGPAILGTRRCPMRGDSERQAQIMLAVTPETFVPADHPLRRIKPLVDDCLARLSPRFDAMYAQRGRPSIPPEHLLKGSLLIALYSVRSERQFCEQLRYNLLFKWFLDLNVEDAPFNATTFSKNRVRLLEAAVARAFFAEVVDEARRRRLMSDDHFSVDGTLLEAWASLKSYRPRDEQAPPPAAGGGRNAEVDFRGQRRRRETHVSRTDAEAQLYTKGSGQAAKLSYLGHALSENRHGLVVDVELTQADGTGERDAALAMLARSVRGRATLGADRAYDTRDFVAALRARGVTPHVARNDRGRRSAIDGRTTRHPGYGRSLRHRKRVEEVFGWLKTVGGGRKLRYVGRERNRAWLELTAAAYNLVRIARLEPVPR